jgi:hypothetical protein
MEWLARSPRLYRRGHTDGRSGRSGRERSVRSVRSLGGLGVLLGHVHRAKAGSVTN